MDKDSREKLPSQYMQVDVKTGRTLLVSGPASLRLLDGKVRVLGYPLEKQRRIVIKKGRQLPVEALDDSRLDCYISNSASCSEIRGSPIPDSWFDTMETILEARKGKTVIVGNVDTGKTTFCTVVANLARKVGLKVAVIDADLGQSDIGPPGTIGLGRVENYVLSLSDVTPDLLYFVGYISPTPIREKVLRGIERLVDRVTTFDILAVNTDGWVVDSQAIVYKKRLIDTVDPDFVVGVGEEHEVSPILELTECISFQIESSSIVLKRTKEQRRELREFGYRKYLTGAKSMMVDTRRIQLSYSGGRILKPMDIDESLVKALVGLIDDHGWLLGIGVLQGVDTKDRFLRVYSPVTRGFTKIEIGALKVSEQGTELSYLEWE